MLESDEQRLVEGISELHIDSDDDTVRRLCQYIDELVLWNQRLGLVSSAGQDLIVRHILDSLAAVETVQAEIERLVAAHQSPIVIADLGSGAGLPGIPIACFTPSASWILVERSGRKAGFLRNGIAAAGLPNVAVVDRDLSQTPAQFHVAVMRAFRPLTSDLIDEVRSHIVAPGAILAFKGKRERIYEEIAGLSIDEIDVLPLTVPFLDEERHIVRLRFA